MRTAAVCAIVGLLALGTCELSAQRSGARLQTAPPQSPPAQQPDPSRVGRPGPGRNPAEQPGLNMADVNDMFQGLEISEVERFLQLTAEQWAPFMKEFRQYQQVRNRHQMQRNRLVMAIRQALNGFQNQPPADDATVEGLVKKLADFEQQIGAELKARHAAIDAVLSIRQRARFIVFQENMERRKIELLAKVLRSQGREPMPQAPNPNR
jgi:hypothetical protein